MSQRAPGVISLSEEAADVRTTGRAPGHRFRLWLGAFLLAERGRSLRVSEIGPAPLSVAQARMLERLGLTYGAPGVSDYLRNSSIDREQSVKSGKGNVHPTFTDAARGSLVGSRGLPEAGLPPRFPSGAQTSEVSANSRSARRPGDAADPVLAPSAEAGGADAARISSALSASRSAALWPGLGRSEPGGALLVGDKPGPGWGRAANWPFISGLRSGCSAWLADVLEAASIPETELRWINAYGVDDAATDGTFVLDYAPRVIVALGRRAAGWCAAQGFAYREVYHPMHWCRFHRRKRYQLIKELQR